ncbi:MAG: P-loop NTPase [Deltaproteobacteria bacterium]|nr:P-loop NTPase [Deltaproteobacteria bacterium]
MVSKKEFYTLEEVCSTLGLEKSLIQFMEREFGGFFGFSKLSPFPSLYSQKQVKIFGKIHRLLNRPDLSIAKIKAEFRQLCLERGKGVFVITVASGKGGVGKTSLAVNLSVMLAHRGLRTVLFDADFGLANDHVFLGLNPQKTLIDLLKGTAPVEEILAEGPFGLKLIPGASGVFQLAEMNQDQRDLLVDEMIRLRKMTDVLVIDTSAGISRNVLHFLGLADEVLAVTTPNIAATLDVFGLLRVAAGQNVPGNLNLLVNRAHSRREAEQVHEKIARCSDQFLGKKVGALGFILEDPAMENAIQRRRSLAEWSPLAPSIVCLEKVVQKLVRKKKQWKGGSKSKFYDLFYPLAV